MCFVRSITFLFLLFPLVLQSQLSENEIQEIRSYYQQMVEDWEVPGMSVAIVKDGQIVFSEGFGTKSVEVEDRPDGNSLFAIASNSKAFTATLLAMLVDEGKINWDDKVKDYVPYFEVYDPGISHLVTVRDLLCHRVGLGTFSGDVVWYKSKLTSEQIIRRMKYIPQAYEFRSGWGYSNLMYITAGEVIKSVTGKSWAENVQERILDPLKMDRTLTNINQFEGRSNIATPHALVEGKNVTIDWVDWSEIGAMGGLIASVNDIAKWMILNLNKGVNGTDTLVNPYAFNTLWKPHNNFMVNHVRGNDVNRHFSGYGLGWALSDYHGMLMCAHGGGFDGMISRVAMIPDKKIGVVVLTNGMKSPARAAADYALDRLTVNTGKDFSKDYLLNTNNRIAQDKRIENRLNARKVNTSPSLDLRAYAGVYRSDIYGDITIAVDGGNLRMEFEHTPEYSCTLRHWHFNVWKIDWDKPQAWFQYGTVGFKLDNNLKVTGINFDVPNDDIFFEELKPYKVE